VQADSVVPDFQNPLDYDRYSYVRNNPVRLVDPSGHKACDNEGDSDCNGGYGGAYYGMSAIDKLWVRVGYDKDKFVHTILNGYRNQDRINDLIILALTIFSESGNGTFPQSVMEMIGEVFLNRVNSGLFPNLARAVIGSNSALQSSNLTTIDFPILSEINNLPKEELTSILVSISISLSESKNADGWANSIIASFTAMYNENNPSFNATDFVMATDALAWEGMMVSAKYRSNPSNAWAPFYKYSTMGPFWNPYPPGIGRNIWILFDNRSFCFGMTGIP
jgi:hypothetical protein